MRISHYGIILRTGIIGIITLSVYWLLITFIFTFLNQSVNEPRLTVINFALPYLLTILTLIFLGIRLLFEIVSKIKLELNFIVATSLIILLSALIIWQLWFVTKIFILNKRFNFIRNFEELIPMFVGMAATLYSIKILLPRKNAS